MFFQVGPLELNMGGNSTGHKRRNIGRQFQIITVPGTEALPNWSARSGINKSINIV